MTWLSKKVVWTAIAATLTLAGTCFAPHFTAHPLAQQILAFVTGLCIILEGVFVGGAVVADNVRQFRAMRNFYGKE